MNIKNKKRNLMLQISSIKLKINNSGNQKIYFTGTSGYCEGFKKPDEIYINGKNQSEIKDVYHFEEENNEIILIWYEPLDYAACMFQGCSSITEIDLTNFDDSRLLKIHYMFDRSLFIIGKN